MSNAEREIWFVNLYKWAPWTVTPVHWKGWLLLLGGPILLLAVGNVGDRLIPFGLDVAIFVIGIVVLLLAIYRHTTWS